MTKSKRNSLKRIEDADSKEAYFKTHCLDGLVYWTNTTMSLAGTSVTMSALLDVMCTVIEETVPPKQATDVKDIIMSSLNDAFSRVRSLPGDDDDTEKVTQEFSKSSDKSTMN